MTTTSGSTWGPSPTLPRERSSNQSRNCNIYSAQFSPAKNNFSIFVGSSNPNFVRVLEAKRGEASGHSPAAAIRGFAKGIYSIHVDQTSRHLAAGCGDRFVSVLNVAISE